MSWALNEAPVDEPVQVLILVAMAERANDDGTDTHQSIATIADKARVSNRTVQRELRKLELLGIISKGDQDLVAKFPGNRRPVVYDIDTTLRRGDILSPQRGDTATAPQSEKLGATTATLRGDMEPLRGDMEGGLGATRTAHNTSLTRPLNSSIDSGETQLQFPGLPGSTAIAVPDPEKPPLEAQLAKRAYDNTKGALPYMGMMKISQWALRQGYTAREIDGVIANLWRSARAVNQQTVAQALQGIIRPDGSRPRPSTTDVRVQQGMDLTAQLKQEAELREQAH